MTALAELPKTLLKSFDNERRHPKMQRTADQSGCITAVGKIVTQSVIHKVGHTLSGCSLFHIALQPAVFLQFLLKTEHA